MMFAGAAGAAVPSKAAEAAAALLTELIDAPGADEVAAQGIQAAANTGVVAAAELMAATIRQHGESPAAALNCTQINTQIQRDSRTTASTERID